MSVRVFGVSVQGASHKRTGKECQDSCKSLGQGQISILAVADGHGSNSCPYSKDGSEAAVNVFCEIMLRYCENYQHDTETLLTFLKREGDTKVAQAIDHEWKRRIREVHADNQREEYKNDSGAALYGLYGSTLLGLLIMPSFWFAFQLGDGDMVYIDNDGISPLLVTEKILGIETHSLSKADSWKKAITLTKRTVPGKGALPYAFMLTTDGYANSYANEEEYKKSVEGYFGLIKEYGVDAVAEKLEEWLSETSEMGCGDDITALIAFFGI